MLAPRKSVLWDIIKATTESQDSLSGKQDKRQLLCLLIGIRTISENDAEFQKDL